VADFCTGSGCIAVSLAKAWNDARVEGWDVSPQALAYARRNGINHDVCIEWRECDLLQYVPHDEPRYEVMVSNPPYILQSEAEEMERTVTEWEPHMALFVPDDDALRFYRAIAEWGMTEALKPGGSIYVEINQALGKETVALFENYGYKEVTLRKDIYGNDRMVKGVKSEE
jgi:release factor glutamine methyltransferase